MGGHTGSMSRTHAAGPEIGTFLRTRRARVTPAQAGINPGLTRRRVPGLRREELAQLAGVSVDYYVHLEQGRAAHVSDAILDALARVLELSAVEREHLGNLAHSRRSRPGSTPPLSAHVRQLLDLMSDIPALVMGRRMEVLGWNSAAEAVFGMTSMTAADGGVARAMFLDSAARTLYLNWDDVAADVVGQLRLEAGQYPDDPRLASLVGELSMRSEPFRQLWANGDVKRKIGGITRLAHPVVGELEFHYGVQALIEQPFQSLLTYSYARGSSTAERVQLLLSWLNSPTPVTGDRVEAGTAPVAWIGSTHSTASQRPGAGSWLVSAAPPGNS